MIVQTLIWLAVPFFCGFLIYLLPKLDRPLALLGSMVSAAFALHLLVGQYGAEYLTGTPTPTAFTFRLLHHFGVSLILDSLTGFFILTNALVTAAVICYCWQTPKSTFFYAQMLILHGSVNAAFACSDFISLYVALEVLSIASFLLIVYPRTNASIWVGLRYLFVSNVAMLFFLVGAMLVYQTHHSFDFAGLKGAPPEAIALIFLGLLVKGGIFIAGLWLPVTHSESEPPVSALMSGVVVKAGVLPLVRCALVFEEIDPIVRLLGVGTALLGVFYAVLEKDAKRMLAFHTISQLGFILAAPVVGGFYALTHGLVKACLFLTVGLLPSRNLKELQHQPIATALWIPLAVASFSISGFPLLSGFGAKVLTMKSVLPWQTMGMNIAALGTAISFAKLIFLPHQPQPPLAGNAKPLVLTSGYWIAMGLLIGGLLAANVVYYKAYSVENMVKPLAIIALGWLGYWLIFRHLAIKLPRMFEQFEHLIGVMSLSLMLLFWMALV
jgi:multicomponent Na+:H+ antiporter subunit D